MLLVAPVLPEHRLELEPAVRRQMEHDPDLRRRVSLPRSTIPAVTHVDYSSRVQTVDGERNPRLYALLAGFYRRTGCPVLINTSFNVRGEPIVCSPQDAYRCFLGTDLDALVLENCVLRRADVAQAESETAKEAYRSQFSPD